MIDKKFSLIVCNKTELFIIKLSIGGVLGPRKNLFSTSCLQPCSKYFGKY